MVRIRNALICLRVAFLGVSFACPTRAPLYKSLCIISVVMIFMVFGPTCAEEPGDNAGWVLSRGAVLILRCAATFLSQLPFHLVREAAGAC